MSLLLIRYINAFFVTVFLYDTGAPDPANANNILWVYREFTEQKLNQSMIAKKGLVSSLNSQVRVPDFILQVCESGYINKQSEE